MPTCIVSGHPLAQKIIERCKALHLELKELVFRYTGSGKKISVLEPLVGKSGFLSVTALTATIAGNRRSYSLGGSLR